jgi:hypothetical protein
MIGGGIGINAIGGTGGLANRDHSNHLVIEVIATKRVSGTITENTSKRVDGAVTEVLTKRVDGLVTESITKRVPGVELVPVHHDAWGGRWGDHPFSDWGRSWITKDPNPNKISRVPILSSRFDRTHHHTGGATKRVS